MFLTSSHSHGLYIYMIQWYRWAKKKKNKIKNRPSTIHTRRPVEIRLNSEKFLLYNVLLFFPGTNSRVKIQTCKNILSSQTSKITLILPSRTTDFSTDNFRWIYTLFNIHTKHTIIDIFINTRIHFLETRVRIIRRKELRFYYVRILILMISMELSLRVSGTAVYYYV